MSVSRWDPFTVLARLDDEFDELVRRAWGGGQSVTRSSGYVPAIEMTTDGTDVLIRFELPGVDAEHDLDIEVEDRRLTVSGQRRESDERREREGRVLVRELRYGSFRREFALPEGVTADEISAHYDAGMLEVRIRNVTKPVEAPRKVEITSAEEGRTITGAQPDKKVKS